MFDELKICNIMGIDDKSFLKKLILDLDLIYIVNRFLNE